MEGVIATSTADDRARVSTHDRFGADLLSAASRLHGYMCKAHWLPGGLLGPDPGVRFEARIGRFVKSYLRPKRFEEQHYYLQAQSYWALGNWAFYDIDPNDRYRTIALDCAREILNRQVEDGSWVYPHPEWSGKIPTNEGAWASMALLEAFRRTQDEEFLHGAQSWFAFLRENTPILSVDGTLAVNYFAGKPGSRVTNKSVTLLRFLAELRRACGTQEFVDLEAGLVDFVDSVQMESGELPYAVHRTSAQETRPHFQCYQYNAFEYLNLVRYHELTGEAKSRRIAERIAEFLTQGLDRDGSAFFDCSHGPRRVVYHAVAAATALAVSGALGREEHADLVRTSMDWALARQRANGAFTYSLRDYGFLADRRSYPRYQSMILMHLLTGSQLGDPANELIAAGGAVLPSAPLEGVA